MKIKTNNVPRDVIYGWELYANEREQFDYIDWDAVERGETMPEFFRYKGELYDLGEFATTGHIMDDEVTKWDGYQSDSFFSGIVIRWPREDGQSEPDFERVIVGTYMV
jgi:hypothetical protein